MEKENQNYEELILQFLKSYKAKWGSSKTMELMQDIIQKKPLDCLSNELEKMGTERLSEELSKIILNQIRSNISNKYDVTSLLPSILKNHMTVSNKKNHLHNVRFVKKTFVKAAILTCTTMAIGISKPSIVSMGDMYQKKSISEKPVLFPKRLQILFSNLSSNSAYKVEKINYKVVDQKMVTPPVIIAPTKTPTITQEPIKVPSLEVSSKKNTDSDTKNHKSEEKINELNTMLKMEDKEDIEKDKKTEILNDFHKCKTISSILKRQKELESLGLTKKDKLYKGCKLSAPLQRFIYEQSLAWNITSPDFTFAIIDTETRGGFGSSGSKTYNKGSGTSDLGLTQQNDHYRVRPFAKAYGISYEKAKKLVQHNDYVNVVCAFLEYQEIASHFDEFSAAEYAGCYNGWLDWRKIAISRNYVKLFKNAYQNKYTKYHKVESKSTIKKEKNKMYIKK